MSNLTYRDLLKALKELPEKSLDMNVTIAIADGCDGVEFLPVKENLLADDSKIEPYTDGVLEPEQPVLVTDGVAISSPAIFSVICPDCNSVLEIEEGTIKECQCGTELDDKGNVI